jgi:hypothetical protein
MSEDAISNQMNRAIHKLDVKRGIIGDWRTELDDDMKTVVANRIKKFKAALHSIDQQIIMLRSDYDRYEANLERTEKFFSESFEDDLPDIPQGFSNKASMDLFNGDPKIEIEPDIEWKNQQKPLE